MCRLSPGQTDHAVENRIEYIQRRFQLPMLRDNRSSLKRLDPETSLPALLWALAKTFLREGSDGSLRVHSRLLELWQDLILVVPPLLVSSAWIADQLSQDPNLISGGNLKPSADRQREVAHRIARWLCDSTLPVDDDPFLDYLCRSHGLDEVHMHLNGSTDAEKVWFDALRRPGEVLADVLSARQQDSGARISVGNGVERLLRQEDTHLTRRLLRHRLDIAICCKLSLLFGVQNQMPEGEERLPLAVLLRRAEEATLASGARHSPAFVVKDAWQLCQILIRLSKGRADPGDGLIFWHYALLRAQFCRLMVQQTEQKGFDQFQHITLNGLREATERQFAERFRQFERGQQQGIDYLEGRLAPKNSPIGLEDRLRSILLGYLRFLQEDEWGIRKFSQQPSTSLSGLITQIKALETGGLDESPTGGIRKTSRRLRLGLVVHFIKKHPRAYERGQYEGLNRGRPSCRDSVARREADQVARAIVAVMKRNPKLSYFLRGIDAASNERHSSPEVFAPAYRRLRAAGLRRMTYHVGEDFIHIASGLRAIMEAVLFLELDAGCRIGHGTAAGLDVEAWWHAVGGYVTMSCEDRLDDLLFARDILLRRREGLQRLPVINAEIERLARYIWDDPSVTPDHLVQAWRLRGLDPLAWEHAANDVEPCRRAESKRLEAAQQTLPKAYRLFLSRHGLVDRQVGQYQRGQEKIVIEGGSDVLDGGLLHQLQLGILNELWQRRIAIETLPTSNIRISTHNTYDTHHSKNWVHCHQETGGVPVSFVIGSDDPGIFATNLRLEYAHMMRILQKRAHELQTGERADVLLEQISLDAKRFRF